MQLQLFRLDGSPDLGLSRVLFDPNQTTTTFWAGSFEGELMMIDWSIKPSSNKEAITVEGGAEPKADNV
jgi:hypothetical protein